MCSVLASPTVRITGLYCSSFGAVLPRWEVGFTWASAAPVQHLCCHMYRLWYMKAAPNACMRGRPRLYPRLPLRC